jgi:hypothetical protein
MRFYVHDYQHKGAPFREALFEAGHLSNNLRPDVILFDRDWISPRGQQIPRPEIQRWPQATAMVYPHAALPPWWYDGIVEVQPHLKAIFVIGEGQRRAMEIIAPGMRVETCGWPWCEQLPFIAPDKVRRVLFAPIHPPPARQLRPEGIEANRAVLEALKAWQQKSGGQVVVRHIWKPEQQGLEHVREFKWVNGAMDGSTAEIDQADVVIAEGTFMYLAVARGKPTIGINQHIPTRPNVSQTTPANWDKYGSDLAYPINFGDAPLDVMIGRAAACEQSVWRWRFIGESLNAHDFSEKVERVWRDDQRARKGEQRC